MTYALSEIALLYLFPLTAADRHQEGDTFLLWSEEFPPLKLP